MRAAVIGSWRARRQADWDLEYQEHFTTACTHIGSTLARNGITMMMPETSDNECAEFHAYRGYVNSQGQRTDGIDAISAHRSLQAKGAAHILAVQKADVVIAIGGTDAAYNAAIAAAELRRRLLVIPCFGGAARSILKLYPPPEGCTELTLHRDWMYSEGWLSDLMSSFERHLQSYPRLLLIHGRNMDRKEVREIVTGMNFAGMSDPVIMEEHGQGSPAIPKLFEELASHVDAAIAIATPDDVGRPVLNAGGVEFSRRQKSHARARQNVWLEIGWFWGTLGFNKILVLIKGNLEIPSDFSGIRFIRYEHSPREVEASIRNFINGLRLRN